ncbi:TPA: hypothetical protein N0F65_000471 [Lagenidium giganteum]|uniref:Uncharacterized protein n=1 Tax=Lagenidium giganteum TaxID=4803 RepID=A0AAV2YYL4_9STRA|nr:TPA: hypothetical protein N0F65_000471 [Lagenidium giganteum]
MLAFPYVIIAVLHGVARACPSVCHCIGDVRISVYCDFRGLDVICSCSSVSTTARYFNGNQFTQVVPAMFIGNVRNADGTLAPDKTPLNRLMVIRLDLNPIAIVNEHSFINTPSLQTIYLPFDVKIQRQSFAEMKLDKDTFDGYTRIPAHPLEDAQFVAFSQFTFNQ